MAESEVLQLDARCDVLSRELWPKQFSSHFEEECAPFQYALSTRAGTDCVGHLLRAATDASPTATVLSVDGIGAFDHVLSEVGHVEQVGGDGGGEGVAPTVNLPPTVGMTIPAKGGQSPKLKAGSRVTR